MATIFFAWELGSGLGHVAEIAPLANPLAARGHRVFAALRDLRAGQGLLDPAVIPLPAPFLLGPGAGDATLSFASILRDVGFGDPRALPVLAAAWRNLFKLVRPDLIIFDHSPTALLAARGLKARRMLLGGGFCMPPDLPLFPALSATPEAAPDQLRDLEAPLLRQANAVLASWSQPPLARLGALYGDVDDTMLATFPEFDCYHHHRPQNTAYFGPVNATGGKPPDWPAGTGKRIFAYLKPFPALKELLTFLKQRAIPSIICLDRLAPAIQNQFACDTLRFETQRVDLARVGQECDLAILYGAHATSIAMLLAGRPSLHVPRSLEHTLNAQAVVRQGAGLIAAPTDPQAVITQLQALLDDDSDHYIQSARRFAQRYAHFDPAQQPEAMLSYADQFVHAREHARAG